MKFRKFHIYSIKTKIALLSFIVLFLALLFSGISIYAYMYGVLSKTIIKDNTIIVSNLNQQINYLLDNTKQFSKNIIISDTIQEALRNKDTLSVKDYEYYSNIRNIDEELSKYLLLRDNVIDDIYIIGNDDRIITNSYTGFSENNDWYTQFKVKKTSGFTATHSSVGPSHPNLATKVISYIITINDKYDQDRILGRLVLDLKYEVLAEILKENNGSLRELHLISQDASIYSSEAENSKEESLGLNGLKEFVPGTVLKHGQYYITQRVAEADWTLIGSISENLISSKIRKIGFRFMLILSICMLVLMIIIFPVVNNVTKPIMILNHAMKEVSMGKLDKEIHIRSGDEIELLANGFNLMVRDIKRNLDEMILKEKKQRELELQLLIKQINPHFVYNTLNCVIYLARRIGADDIISLTKSFIRILQHTIRMRPDEMVTIQEEVAYIKNYVDILHYRYEEKVQITLEIDPNLLNYKIPKMILYPLVENSIFHGILPGVNTGKLLLSVQRHGDMIHVAVIDNGIGISPERMIKIQQLMTKDLSDSMEHIGLHNVNQRLRIHYGGFCNLHIESNPNDRTCVSFLLPLDSKNI